MFFFPQKLGHAFFLHNKEEKNKQTAIQWERMIKVLANPLRWYASEYDFILPDSRRKTNSSETIIFIRRINSALFQYDFHEDARHRAIQREFDISNTSI